VGTELDAYAGGEAVTFIAIVEPGTNHLLLRLDAERAIIEIVRRRHKTVIDLTEYGLGYKAPQSAERIAMSDTHQKHLDEWLDDTNARYAKDELIRRGLVVNISYIAVEEVYQIDVSDGTGREMWFFVSKVAMGSVIVPGALADIIEKRFRELYQERQEGFKEQQAL